MSNAELHSVEHLFATLLRNSAQKDAVLYFGPMGCQTGFYLLVDGTKLDHSGAIALMRQVCAQCGLMRGICPGKARWNAGNYRNLEIWRRPKKLCAAVYARPRRTGQRKSCATKACLLKFCPSFTRAWWHGGGEGRRISGRERKGSGMMPATYAHFRAGETSAAGWIRRRSA